MHASITAAPRTRHYHAIAGLRGCIPNYSEKLGSYREAVDDLANLHELGHTRKAKLARAGYLDLNLGCDENPYAEIIECDRGDCVSDDPEYAPLEPDDDDDIHLLVDRLRTEVLDGPAVFADYRSVRIEPQ